jgi:hypothetical protein
MAGGVFDRVTAPVLAVFRRPTAHVCYVRLHFLTGFSNNRIDQRRSLYGIYAANC